MKTIQYEALSNAVKNKFITLLASMEGLGTLSTKDMPPSDGKIYGFKNGELFIIDTAFELSPKPSVEGANRFTGATFEEAKAKLEARMNLAENADDKATYEENELKVVVLAYQKDSVPAMQFMSLVDGVWIPTVDSVMKTLAASDIKLTDIIGGVDALERITALEAAPKLLFVDTLPADPLPDTLYVMR